MRELLKVESPHGHPGVGEGRAGRRRMRELDLSNYGVGEHTHCAPTKPKESTTKKIDDGVRFEPMTSSTRDCSDIHSPNMVSV